MYPIDQIITQLDSSPVVVLAALPAFICAFVLYGEGVRVGFRDRVHGIPWFSNMYFFAHDVIFLLLFSRWFVELNHWAFKLFWMAFVGYVSLEFIVHYHTLRYGRKQLFPRLGRASYAIVYLGLQAAIFAAFWSVYQRIDDYLFLESFNTTWLVTVVFNLIMLKRRGSRLGQSMVLAIAVLVGSSTYYLVFLPMLSPYFISVYHIGLGSVVTILAAMYVWNLSRAPVAERATGD